ncbi:sulfatase-like hydrolase/transferase [Halosquirtibacter laminarini]|uniref:Sulfatase-like hydrolase/transferase n=1 Tax=Halosquirtibacter laminarini TaxID=3374600 RepID=A0AC61NMZ8_9BACT|nr:sulfatase-like hydrolase/transferase [Prolixibacteraceae bacterium]
MNLMKNLVPMLLLGAVGCNKSTEPAKQRPNVIVILTDDMGYQDVGFNGCKDIPTPNIDRVANEGVCFTNGYVSYSVCGPSRAGLLTGRYQERFGFGRNPLFTPNDSNQGVPLSEEMIPATLKREGYRSMALGKWHLGTTPELHPRSRGFDEFFGFLGGGHMYFPKNLNIDDYLDVNSQSATYRTKILHNGERVREKEYLTDALSREAVSFIDKSSKEPFFLYLAYNAPHVPLQATKKYMDRFTHIKNRKRRTYAAMVSAVDDGVGSILAKLKEKGIEDNTIVFFLSDNGGPEQHNASNNGVLRDGKRSLYEGGVHVPFAMRWPAQIKGGQVYDKPVISLDIFATAVVYSGAKPKNPLDGVNIVPYITGEKRGVPHEQLAWRTFDTGSYALRCGDKKIIKVGDQPQEIYNLKQDIGETTPLNNVSDQERDALKNRVDGWQSELKDPVFIGLHHGKEYDKLHPERWVNKKRIGNTYYIDPVNGSDENRGFTKETALKSLERFKRVVLLPGDTVKIKYNANIFTPISFKDVQGKADNPIVFTHYGYPQNVKKDSSYLKKWMPPHDKYIEVIH